MDHQNLKTSFKTNMKKNFQQGKHQQFSSALQNSIEHTLQKYINSSMQNISAQLTKRNIPKLNIGNIAENAPISNDYLSTKRLKQSEQIIEESDRQGYILSQYGSSPMMSSRNFPYTIDNVDMKKSQIVQVADSDFQKQIYEKFGYELQNCIRATKKLQANLVQLENQQDTMEENILEEKIQQQVAEYWKTIFTSVAVHMVLQEKQSMSITSKQHLSIQSEDISQQDSLLSCQNTEKMKQMLYMINSLKRKNRELQQMLEDCTSQQSSFLRSKAYTEQLNNWQQTKLAIASEQLKFVSPERKILIFNDKQNKNSLNHISSQELLKIAFPSNNYSINELSEQSMNQLQQSPCFKQSSQKKWFASSSSDIQLSLYKQHNEQQQQNFSFSCCKQSFEDKNEAIERQISKQKFSAINKLYDPSSQSDTIQINDFSIFCQKCRKSVSIVHQLPSFDDKMKNLEDSFESQVNRMLIPLTIKSKKQNNILKQNSVRTNQLEECQSNYECQNYINHTLIDEKSLQNILSKFKQLFRKLLTSTVLLCKYSKKIHKYNQKNKGVGQNKRNFDKVKKVAQMSTGSLVIKHNLLEENLKEVMEWYKNFSIQCKSISEKVIESFIDQCMEKTELFYSHVNDAVHHFK